MELTEVLKSRRSIRKFKAEPIPDDFIKGLLEAARLAPSGLNVQPWRFIVIKSEAVRKDLAKATPSVFITKAPVVIVCCADTKAFETTGIRVKELQEARAFSDTPFSEYTPGDFINKNENMNEFWLKANLAFNVAISIEHIALKATDLGLGSCWIGVFDQKKIKKIAAIDDSYDVISLMAVGYPDQDPGLRPRLSIGEILLKEI